MNKNPEYVLDSRIEPKSKEDEDDLLHFENRINGEFITVGEYAWKYGIHPRTVQSWCAEGRIEGAFKFGNSWAIPNKAPRPKDHRYKNGEWVGYRKRERKKDKI